MTELTLRPATVDDIQRLFEWRNDPDTRKSSRNREPISLGEHKTWLLRSLSDTSRILLIAEQEEVPVGVVRADEKSGVVELSWTIAPEARGRGLGKSMVVQFVRERLSGKKIRASVRKGNIPSEKIAEALGLRPTVPEENSGDPPMIVWN
ncbi:hypothetical protein A3A39_02350 [Candidatus Kaiserbacteria bacterium RIFCSPLOWO2_01_FULL_54_13]|uniref:N-acetyltransferase domain-containing protein n=1 Tax=Candidatus Kaiserbacteria bacterium RIFCSPLOWO2_01_FULL_54_13 TaxID=1798512 RepID=A0A1F6F109_9BACT|nr:MAG: hypothetical protein A3A39_02350 [Candidatus Kaiserbacteria bacterium RIFCSPLOWO2_01_FULL_54_13]